MSKVIYKFGDDISTDIIYPGRYMATILPTETPELDINHSQLIPLSRNSDASASKNIAEILTSLESSDA